jgi:hypothetical protein
MRAIEGGWRLLQQDLQDSAEEVQVRGAARFDVEPKAACAEAFGNDKHHAANERQHHHLRATNMEEGLPQVEHIAIPRTRHQGRGFAGEAQHTVRDEHALGPTGRAGCVHDGEGRIDGNGCGGEARSGGLLTQRQCAGFDRHCRPQIGTAGRNDLHQVWLCNDDVRTGVLQHVSEIVANGLSVDGNPNRTCTVRSPALRRALSRVPQHERDTVPRMHLVVAKPAGQHRRPPVEDTEGQRALPYAGEHALRRGGCKTLE